MGQRTSRPTGDLENKQQVLGLDEKDEQERIRITTLRDSRMAKRLQIADNAEYQQRIFRKGDVENMDDGLDEFRAFDERRKREAMFRFRIMMFFFAIGLCFNLWTLFVAFREFAWFRKLLGLKDPNAAISN